MPTNTTILAATCLAAGAMTVIAPAAEATILRPDKVVVVILQDRASDAVGNPIWDYLNDTIVGDGLVYTNSHGVTQYTLLNSLAIYSGSLQFQGGNGYDQTIYWEPPTIATELQDAGFSFRGFVESLPESGSQVYEAGPSDFPDLYTRNLNPMAMFTGTDDDDVPIPNPHVNQQFEEFQAITDYSALPTVSYVIPNNLHNTHGTNDKTSPQPKAGSSDLANNNSLRDLADDWLEAELDAYLQWAKTNNSLLIVTQDEEWSVGGSSDTVTTIINGDSRLFDAGTNGHYFNHYNLLRTLTDMYGLEPLGLTDSYSAFTTDSAGKLTVPEPAALSLLGVGSLLLARRKRAEATA